MTDSKKTMAHGEELLAGNINKAIKDSGATRGTDLISVPIDKINQMEGFNVRYERPALKEHIERLVDSIMQTGFHQDKPLSGIIRMEDGEDKIFIYDGHTRLAAAKLARERGVPLETLPVMINRSASWVDINVGLVRSNTGEPLTFHEKSQVVDRLRKLGLTVSRISELTGIPSGYVSYMLSIYLPAPAIVHEWVAEEVFTHNFVIKAIKEHQGNAIEFLRNELRMREKVGEEEYKKTTTAQAKFKRYIGKKAPTMINAFSRLMKDDSFREMLVKFDPKLGEELFFIVEESEALLDVVLNVKKG